MNIRLMLNRDQRREFERLLGATSELPEDGNPLARQKVQTFTFDAVGESVQEEDN